MSYWEAIEDVAEKVDIYSGAKKYQQDLAKLPAKQRRLLVLHYLTFEVLNGGLLQYFVNSSGVTAPDALEALEAIGQPEAKQWLAQAMAYFPEGYPLNRTKRRSYFKNTYMLQGKDPSPFRELDDKFYEEGENDVRLCEWLNDYAANSAID